jgi:hypothetical protein
MLLPSRCAPPPRFALTPPPLTLPPPPCCRQASADVALSRCRHRRRSAVALPPPPLTLLPLLRCRHAAADIALSRCRHRRSIRAAATALPPLRCAPPPCFALPPQPNGVSGSGSRVFFLRCVFFDMCFFWADFRYLFGFC